MDVKARVKIQVGMTSQRSGPTSTNVSGNTLSATHIVENNTDSFNKSSKEVNKSNAPEEHRTNLVSTVHLNQSNNVGGKDIGSTVKVRAPIRINAPTSLTSNISATTSASYKPNVDNSNDVSQMSRSTTASFTASTSHHPELVSLKNEKMKPALGLQAYPVGTFSQPKVRVQTTTTTTNNVSGGAPKRPITVPSIRSSHNSVVSATVSTHGQTSLDSNNRITDGKTTISESSGDGHGNQLNQTTDNKALTLQSTERYGAIDRSTVKMVDLCYRAYMKQLNLPPKHQKRTLQNMNQDAEMSGNTKVLPSDSKDQTILGMSSSSDQIIGQHSSTTNTPAAKRMKHNDPIQPKQSTGAQVEWVDGKIRVKESSLVVQDHSQLNEGEFEEVNEGTHAVATYKSFLREQKHEKWGVEETKRFFHVLRQCGTEFSIMQSFFPGRTRKQLKLKYRREEREHPELVRQSLENIQELDLRPFSSLYADRGTSLNSADAHINALSQPISQTTFQRKTTDSDDWLNATFIPPTYKLIPNLPPIFDVSLDDEETWCDI